jgi:hypothetical protein
MNKTILSLFIIITLGSAISINSGIKAAIDSSLIKYLETIDLMKLISNKTLIDSDGIIVEKTTFPSYRLKVYNTTITHIVNPNNIETSVSTDSQGNKILNASLENIQVNISLCYDFEFMEIINESGQNVPIGIIMNSFGGEVVFQKGDVVFNSLQVDISKIDINFQSRILELLYKYLGGFILDYINDKIPLLKGAISDELHQLIFSLQIINLGNAILIDGSNVDRPDILIHNNATPFKLGFLEDSIDFLAETRYIPAQPSVDSLVTLGVVGAIYPFDPKFRPVCDPAAPMSFDDHVFDKKLNLLVSDFTLNNLLYLAQYYGQFTGYWSQDSGDNIFGVPLDTAGLGTFISQLNTTFNSTHNVDVKAGVYPGSEEPIATITDNGTVINFKWDISFAVYVTDNPMDVPVPYLTVTVDTTVTLNTQVGNDSLKIYVVDQQVNNVLATLNLLVGFNPSTSTDDFSRILSKFTDSFNNQFSDIKIYDFLDNYTTLKFKNLSIDSKDRFYSLAIDLDN